MSMNYLINVPKLKGRENYDEWAFAAENYLVLEGMLKCVKPEPEAPVNAADDAKTKAKLILTIDPSLYVHIKNVSTSQELWNTLKTTFDDSGYTRRISLLRNLISIRRENCTTMTAYVTQIVETGQKLSGTGFNINDEWIGSLLLAGLPEKFTPMIMAIEHSGIPITADAIKSKLLDMEPELISDVTVDSAFAANSAHRWQHRKKFSANHGTTSNVKTNYNTSKKNVNVKCYKCKEVGHYRNQCPTNMAIISEKQTNAFSAVFLTGNFNKSNWYIDSGASVHLTANESWIKNASYNQSHEVVVANKTKVPVLCTGEVEIKTITNRCHYNVTVENVFCVPSLTTNLLSVSQLISKGNKVAFNNSGCCVYNQKNQLVATAALCDGVYKLNTITDKDLLAGAAVVPADTWHRRLGHVNGNYMNKMKGAVHGLNLDEKVNIAKASCSVCCEGKQSRLPFRHVGNRTNELLKLVHVDICGPMETVSIGGSRYIFLLVDDYSRMTFIYFLKAKSQVITYFKEFKAMAENQTNNKIKLLRSDNGREFCNNDLDDYL